MLLAGKEAGRVKAYILVQTEVGASPAAARDIRGIKGVQSVEQVTGPYDVVVEVETRTIDDLSTDVVASLHQIEGVTRTLTCHAPTG
jgi:DNA-binding Lrp family transcriptional regulator